jgi:hypothetical protein
VNEQPVNTTSSLEILASFQKLLSNYESVSGHKIAISLRRLIFPTITGRVSAKFAKEHQHCEPWIISHSSHSNPNSNPWLTASKAAPRMYHKSKVISLASLRSLECFHRFWI